MSCLSSSFFCKKKGVSHLEFKYEFIKKYPQDKFWENIVFQK